MDDTCPIPITAADRRTEPADEVLRIDCDECELQHTSACGDCVITFLCGLPEHAPVVVDLAEARAMRALDEAGLVPPLRHRRRTG